MSPTPSASTAKTHDFAQPQQPPPSPTKSRPRLHQPEQLRSPRTPPNMTPHRQQHPFNPTESRRATFLRGRPVPGPQTPCGRPRVPWVWACRRRPPVPDPQEGGPRWFPPPPLSTSRAVPSRAHRRWPPECDGVTRPPFPGAPLRVAPRSPPQRWACRPSNGRPAAGGSTARPVSRRAVGHGPGT